MGLVPVPMGKYAINMHTEIISKSGRCCEGKQVRESSRLVDKEVAFELTLETMMRCNQRSEGSSRQKEHAKALRWE